MIAGRIRAMPLVTAGLAAAIFLADTVTHYEIAAATFYVVVVLLASRFCRRRSLLAVTGGCVLLTLASYFLTKDGDFRTGIVNTAISLLAIVAVAWLALRGQAARDLAEQAEAQLARVSRITLLGEMGAAIAHEVNQPLAAIVTHGDAARRWLANDPPRLDRVGASIEAIADDAARAGAIIARIRARAANAAPRRAPTDLDTVVRRAAAVIEPRLRAQGIALRIAVPPRLPRVMADAVQLQQVVLNLLANALEAIEGPGGEILVHVDRDAAGETHVCVEDNGGGLSPEAAARIFEPFHSTKPGGMGIGLSICRSIVEAHGGRVTAQGCGAGGARIGFTLPPGPIEQAGGRA
jgi:C4-dicarboxylate-specific signal transduction histidine kinase